MEVRSACSLLWSLLLSLHICTALKFSFQDPLTSYQLLPKYGRHPLLFFNAEDLDGLRKSMDTTHRHLYRELVKAKQTITSMAKKTMPPEKAEEFSGKWNEIYGNNLPPLALYYALKPEDPELLKFILTYMDRMASYPSWRVSSAPKDELPLSHSLIGFSTAYDMMHPHLDEARRKKYIAKIVEVTRELYDNSLIRWWGYNFLETQVATNYVALLVGSMVSELDSKEAAEWKKAAIYQLDRSMQLRELISDGSMHEGVSYGSYTSRSLTQFLFLSKRHFNRDFRSHVWLQNHFNFYYYTILPGLKKIIGIADTGDTWGYGPESQLVYLDSFVMRNGNGNWLAEQIRKRKNTTVSARELMHRFCTLHTEILWYDPTLKPTAPKNADGDEMHLFNDWGLVVMRYGAYTDDNSTLLTYKSGKIRGKAMYDLVHKERDDPPSFNAGHQHPDQNSFTFTSRGVEIFTDGYYSPKYTYLENSMMFGPSNNSACTIPWSGQLGDCQKWLKYTKGEEYSAHGKIIAAGFRDGIFFVSGEAKNAYHSNLKIASYYRGIVVLRPELVVLTDHIKLLPGSNITLLSSFFNNVQHTFKRVYYINGLSGIQVQNGNDTYASFWISEGGQSPAPTVVPVTYTSAAGNKLTSCNLNITFQHEGNLTRLVYVFYAPPVKISNFAIFNRYQRNYSYIDLDTNLGKFNIEVGTNYNDIISGRTPRPDTYLAKVQAGNSKHATEFSFGDVLESSGLRELGNIRLLRHTQTYRDQLEDMDGVFHHGWFLVIVVLVIGLLFLVKRTRRVLVKQCTMLPSLLKDLLTRRKARTRFLSTCSQVCADTALLKKA